MQKKSVTDETLKYFKSKRWRQKLKQFVDELDSKCEQTNVEAPIEYTKESEEDMHQQKL